MNEFERIKQAGRGVVRLECGEETVILAQCTTRYENFLPLTRWYVTVYTDNELVDSYQLDSTFTALGLQQIINRYS